MIKTLILNHSVSDILIKNGIEKSKVSIEIISQSVSDYIFKSFSEGKEIIIPNDIDFIIMEQDHNSYGSVSAYWGDKKGLNLLKYLQINNHHLKWSKK